MKVAYAVLENSERMAVFINGSRYLAPIREGLGCLLANPNAVISNYDILSMLEMGEVKVRELLVPVVPEKVLMPAVNFRSHASEGHFERPPYPYFFVKTPNTLVPHNGFIELPRGLERVDYEGEIGIVIGKRGKYIPKEKAWDYIFGFTVLNDVSYRDYQFPGIPQLGLNWVLGKDLDTGLPIGPWVVPKDEVKLPLRITTRLNGEVVQDGTTDDMIFSMEELVHYASQGITLRPGDVIATGTPAGVAEFTGRKYLRHGDVIEVEVTNIGILRNYVRRSE
ncbi:MAG: fumarylacetoacetate hydrolase family protein [Sulfolobaceae archaeon]|nr:fumarylacetoacetate hydrolase family protein [Sulfolobales archaeon]